MSFNKFLGNVYMINTGGWWITVNTGPTGAFSDLAISNIGLYAADTTGELELFYQSDTTMAVFHLRGTQGSGYSDIHFATPHKTSGRIYIKTCANGTGYIYCS